MIPAMVVGASAIAALLFDEPTAAEIVARLGEVMPKDYCSSCKRQSCVLIALNAKMSDSINFARRLSALDWTLSAAGMAEIDAIFTRHRAVTTPDGWLEDDQTATAA